MAIGRISGPLLKANLLRNGQNLAFETDLLYLDVVNRRIGVKTNSPQYALDVNGVARVQDLEITNNTFQVGFPLPHKNFRLQLRITLLLETEF